MTQRGALRQPLTLLLLSIPLCLCDAMLAPEVALADQSAPVMPTLESAGQVTTDPAAGQTASSVAIWAPGFRGIEPAMSIVVQASARNGFVGSGASLRGWSTIERISPRGGVPRLDASDAYARDGEPMVSCASLPGAGASSPGCARGATHAMEVETYERIQLANDTWYVHRADGSRIELAPLQRATVAGVTSTLRWGIAKVADTHGNEVRYAWACEGTPVTECYPSRVSYFPAGAADATVTMQLYREVRADVVDQASGPTLRQMQKRLKTIEVRTGGLLARAYTLGYVSDPVTGRSLLQTVRLFGFDADPYLNKTTGEITGGTTTPTPLTYRFELPPQNLSGEEITGSRARSLGQGSYLGDVDGNGLADFAYLARDTRELWVLRAETTSAPSAAAPRARFGAETLGVTLARTPKQLWLSDVTGDGKADVVYVDEQSGVYRVWVAVSSGDRFLPEGATPWLTLALAPKLVQGKPVAFLGDVNGDARADFTYTTDAQTIRTAISTGSAFSAEIAAAAQYVAGGRTGDGGWLYLVDITGDGKSDWVYNRRGTRELYVKRATITDDTFAFARDELWGTRALQTTIQSVVGTGAPTDNQDPDTGAWADVNGDGKPDFVYAVSSYLTTCSVECASSFAQTCEMLYGPVSRCSTRCGTTPSGGCSCIAQPPVCESTFLSDGRQVMLSAGNVAATESMWGRATGIGSALLDMNGDGLADLAYLSQTTGSAAEVRVALSNGRTFLPATSWGLAQGIRAGLTEVASEKFFADVNGDGKGDFLYVPPRTNELRALQSTGAMMPLVTEIRSELGGLTRLVYTPSTSWSADNDVAVMPTLLSMSVDDGRGTPGSVTTESYRYGGALYDAVRRKFLGYRWVTRRLPCLPEQLACPEETTTYAQDYAGITQPSRIDFVSGAALGKAPVLLSSTQIAYANNGASMPYWSLEVARRVTSFDPSGSGAARSTSVSRWCGAAPCYDAFGNPTQVVDNGFDDVTGDERTTVTQYASGYTAAAQPADVVYVEGRTRRVTVLDAATGATLTDEVHAYDGATGTESVLTRGDLTRSLVWLDTANAWIETRFGYDRFGNRVSITDGNGNTSVTVFDPYFTTFPIEVRNALYDPSTTTGAKQRTLTSWETRCGMPRISTNENDLQTVTGYDPLCRVVQINRPGGDGSLLGDQETRRYALFGAPGVTAESQSILVMQTGANASGSRYAYTYVDGRGRPWQTRTRGASGDVYVRTTYDVRGNVTSESVPTYWSGTGAFPSVGAVKQYDDLGRVTRVVHMDGSSVKMTYGVASTTSEDELGHVSVEERDARGNVIAQTERLTAAPVTTRSTYDVLGRRLRVIDALGNETTYRYDSLGRAIGRSDPDLGKTSTVYDNVGQPVVQTDAMGQRTELEYDALGRLVKQTLRAGTASAWVATWGYDERYGTGFANMGHRTSARSPSDTETFDFNGAGLVTQRVRTIGSRTYVTRYAFDVGGRLRGVRYPDGDGIGLDPVDRTGTPLAYDDGGNLVSVVARSGEVLVRAVSYDALGSVVRQENGNGTVVTNEFDPVRGWLSSIRVTRGASTLFEVGYGRDLEGNVRTMTGDAANEQWSYTYDAMHRLVSAVNAGAPAENQSWRYDVLGNITYDSALGSFRYDGARGGCSGSLLRDPSPNAGRLPHAVSCAGTIAMRYDGNGSMVRGAVGDITYDGRQRPVKIGSLAITYDGDGDRIALTEGTRVTHFPLDGYEVLPSGDVTKSLPLGVERRTSATGFVTSWRHVDGAGSVRVMTDAAGNVIQRVRYKPFGAVASRSTGFIERTGFAGERRDDNGLMFLKARYYDPRIGRFLTADPTLSDGLNRYAYARNNPIAFVDRSGFGTNPWTGEAPFWWAGANDAFTRPMAQKLESRANAGEIRPMSFVSKLRLWWTGGATFSGEMRVGSPQFMANMVNTLSMVTPVGEVRKGIAEAAFWESEVSTRGLLKTVRGTIGKPGVIINRLPPGDPLNGYVQRGYLDCLDGTYSVVAHSNEEKVYSYVTEEIGEALILRGYDGGPVCLFACHTGARPDGPGAELQRILASKVRNPVSVWAPEGAAYDRATRWKDFSLLPAADMGQAANGMSAIGAGFGAINSLSGASDGGGGGGGGSSDGGDAGGDFLSDSFLSGP